MSHRLCMVNSVMWQVLLKRLELLNSQISELQTTHNAVFQDHRANLAEVVSKSQSVLVDCADEHYQLLIITNSTHNNLGSLTK